MCYHIVSCGIVLSCGTVIVCYHVIFIYYTVCTGKYHESVAVLSRVPQARVTITANLKGKKTNHSARKTMVTTLSKENVPETQIMQLSGHRTLQSLNSYKKASLQQQKEMSPVLSAFTQGRQQQHSQVLTPSLASNETTQSTSRETTQSLFQGAHFSGCTLNIGFPLQQTAWSKSEYSCSTVTQSPCKRRRVDTDD